MTLKFSTAACALLFALALTAPTAMAQVESQPADPAPAAAPIVAPPPAADPAAPTAGEPVEIQPADPTIVETEQAPLSTLPHDLSPWGMFIAADWVVKAVMIGLVFASLVTWTIGLAKALELIFAKRRARVAVRRVESARSLADLEGQGRGALRNGPVAALVHAANDERQRSGALAADGIKERVAISLTRIEARAGRRMTRGTGVLATIGSTAPFVGLFGTVWGIMNSFIGISQANTTNLAVVAPGIAEALLATGIGLVAAIPAVIIYNNFARAIGGYRSILSDGSAAILQHLSRDLDARDTVEVSSTLHRLNQAAV
ncbi:tonB-system energizer ExbB [Aureimonas fodinaquatilis]|uniref:Biopolymer transport protein ExbB n=1 Tax=Aureimonas fodinaquatilis TaxID=2565783 RepID=A0A5B0E316_9HYPH|nr:tonB-system energizer ExbB [Aureimonas fodinaquatilis]KAA0972535.1 tonB-system energizer ExbB [Aureimonas fodinaquatilis]